MPSTVMAPRRNSGPLSTTRSRVARVGLRVDLRRGALPGRRRIAVGAQLRQGRVLRVVPGRLAERLARLAAARTSAGPPAGPRPPRRRPARRRRARRSPRARRRAPACADPASTRQPHARRAVGVGAALARHGGVEVALGLEQRACLRRRRGGEAVELGDGHRVAARRLAKAREVEVGLEQLVERLRRDDLELVQRDLRPARRPRCRPWRPGIRRTACSRIRRGSPRARCRAAPAAAPPRIICSTGAWLLRAPAT